MGHSSQSVSDCGAAPASRARVNAASSVLPWVLLAGKQLQTSLGTCGWPMPSGHALRLAGRAEALKGGGCFAAESAASKDRGLFILFIYISGRLGAVCFPLLTVRLTS